VSVFVVQCYIKQHISGSMYTLVIELKKPNILHHEHICQYQQFRAYVTSTSLESKHY